MALSAGSARTPRHAARSATTSDRLYRILKDLRDTERFLQRFRIVTLDQRVCDVAVDLLRQYRLSHGLAIPDALIVSTALGLNCAFVTKNQSDYRFIDGLQLLPYP